MKPISLGENMPGPRRWIALATVLAGLMPTAAMAGFTQLNMPRGATTMSEVIYDLHMFVFWICVVIGVVVFGGIAYSIYAHRKSRGVTPAKFSHSTTLEVVWTVIPFIILVVMAVPATRVLLELEDTSGAEMTVKVTGYQWFWEYEYMDGDAEGHSFASSLDRDSDMARQRNPSMSPWEVDNYLLDVDNPLVLPTNTRIRFLLTANDVIHSWWVPEFGWKKDTIPGFINEAWTEIEEPGVYYGRCAELCGRDHGFMPVVVVAKEPADYEDWVAENVKGGDLDDEDTATAGR